MDTAKIKAHLPTVSTYLEKRRKARQNQLPKHLRPPVVWPIWVQIALNSGLIIGVWNLIVSRDDFMTEAAPAIGLVACFMVMIYTLISAVRMRRFYDKGRGRRLARINLGLMIVAFMSWAATIVVFLS